MGSHPQYKLTVPFCIKRVKRLKQLWMTITYFISGVLVVSNCVGVTHKVLHLRDVYASTKKHFPQVMSALAAIQRARGSLQAASGAFDPSLTSSVANTPEGGYEHVYHETTLNLPMMQTGGNLFVKYRLGQGSWPVYYQNYKTNSGGDLELGLSIPLLRNLQIDKKRAHFMGAQQALAIEHDRYTAVNSSALAAAGTAYWNWVGAIKQLLLQKQLLTLATQRQQALIKKFRLGDLAHIESIDNKRLIIKRQAALIRDKLALKNRTIALSLFYRDKHGQPLIASVSEMPKNPFKLPKIQLKKIWNHKNFNLVYQQSPALKVLARQLKIDQINLKQKENSLLPNLDGTLATSKEFGSGGDPRWRQTAVSVGLKLSVDLPRNIAKGRFEQAHAKVTEDQINLLFKKQQIGVALASVLNELDNDYKQIILRGRELKLAEQVEQAEKTRFTEGDSSLFLVNQREHDTFSAQLNYLNVTLSFEKSLLRLEDLCAYKRSCYLKFIPSLQV